MHLSRQDDSNFAPGQRQEAIDYALARNCVIVAAAGNDNRPGLEYRALLNGVISVGAADKHANSVESGRATTARPGSHLAVGADPGSKRLRHGQQSDMSRAKAPRGKGSAFLCVPARLTRDSLCPHRLLPL